MIHGEGRGFAIPAFARSLCGEGGRHTCQIDSHLHPPYETRPSRKAINKYKPVVVFRSLPGDGAGGSRRGAGSCHPFSAEVVLGTCGSWGWDWFAFMGLGWIPFFFKKKKKKKQKTTTKQQTNTQITTTLFTRSRLGQYPRQTPDRLRQCP